LSQELLFPSPEWAKAYCEALNRSDRYRRAASTWRAGSILFIVRQLPKSIAEAYGSDTVGFILDLHEGVCKGVEWVENPNEADAPFIISATYRDWVDVITGRTHPVTALMMRKLRVEKGDVATLIRYAQAAVAMVETAKSIPTKLYS
jgi:putative sterol carrier protein